MAEFASVRGLLGRVERQAGATPSELDSLRLALAVPWPNDYLDCLRWANGVEGFVSGHGYLWLWPASDVPRLNAAYGVQELAPGLALFGSDAATFGYGFDFATAGAPVVSIEMAAMHRDYLSVVASSFSEFVSCLAAEPLPEGELEPEDCGPPDWLRGKIIHDKHPLMLGGSPEDPENRILIPRDLHPEATVFFARLVHKMRGRSQR